MRTSESERPVFLYREIADKLALQIFHGTLKPGERIPSVRQLTTKLSVSASTALQAYRSLEDRGLIEARPQSGFYVRMRPKDSPDVPRISDPPSAPTAVDISGIALDVHENCLNPDVISLGAATPGDAMLPTARLNRILRTVARRFEERGSRYEPPSGNADLRRFVARSSLHWGCSLKPEDIVITNGATEALNLCLRAATREGDTVAVESPTYYGVLLILESLNLRAIEIPTHPDHGASIDALTTILDQHKVSAVLVQSMFQNPLGCSMGESDKKSLVELLARRSIPLIEDNVYADLGFDGYNPRFMKAYDRKRGVLTCASFSKTLSPGFRVGWAAPGRYIDRVRRLKLTSSISTATLPQIAVAEMLSDHAYDRHLRRVRRLYKEQMHLMAEAAGRYFPRGTKVTRPSGGLMMWEIGRAHV